MAQCKGKDKQKEHPSSVLTPEQLVTAAVTIALATSQGKTQQELETFINLFNLVSDILAPILAQRANVNKTMIVTENVD